MALRERPYHVREVEREEFFDLHSLPKLLRAEHAFKEIPWMKVKYIRVKKGVTNEIV